MHSESIVLLVFVAICLSVVNLGFLLLMNAVLKRVHRNIFLIARGLQIDLLNPGNLSDEVKRLAGDRENPESGKIRAIELCREETGASFSDAVAAVERYIQSQKLPVK